MSDLEKEKVLKGGPNYRRMSERGLGHLCTLFLYSLKAEQSGGFTAFKI